jgi:hypothetical protein
VEEEFSIDVVIHVFNPLNTELNPICQLLALLIAHPIFHVSRIRVNLFIHKTRTKSYYQFYAVQNA